MDENARERYGQRYETWRHLDGLRYQTIQVSLGVFGLAAAFLQADIAVPHSWLMMVTSVIILAQWKLLTKLNDAIVANGIALNQFASEIGDNLVPDVSNRAKSFFYWLEVAFLVIGISLLLIGSIVFFWA